MDKLITRVLSFINREEGQTMAEYALILVGVAVIVAATAVLLGNAIDTTFQDIITAL